MTIRFVCAVLMFFLTIHWIACIQYFISVLEEFPSDSWVTQEDLMDASVGKKYSSAFFRSFCQMTWTSYGSSHPPTRMTEQWSAIVSIVVGWLMLIAVAFGIGKFAAGNANTTELKKREYLEDFEPLPPTLHKRVMEAYRWQQKKNSLGLLPKSLRKDVMKVMCPNLMKGHIASDDVTLIEAILMKLECEIFRAGDDIFQHNAPVEKIYFIETGRVLSETKFFRQELLCGDYFGEIRVLLGGQQSAKVCALTDCKLFTLSVEKLQEVEMDFPEVLTEMRERAYQHLRDIECDATEEDAAESSSSV